MINRLKLHVVIFVVVAVTLLMSHLSINKKQKQIINNRHQISQKKETFLPLQIEL